MTESRQTDATAKGFRPISLDAINFLLADVRGALGPYLNVFLVTQQHCSITARCFGVDVASALSAEHRASLHLSTSVFRLIGSVTRKVPDRATRLAYVAEQNGWMAQLST